MVTDKKIVTYNKLASIRKHATHNNQTIVFATGCYDILHLGHVIHLNFCKERGDILVVSVGSDKTLRKLKGPGRPINPEKFRARMLAALQIVDYVVISEELGSFDHNESMKLLKPDFYVMPSTDKFLQERKDITTQLGVKLITTRRNPPNNLAGGISTTQIANKLEELDTEN